jgi:FAD/FMN-containing dehydrogenase
MTATRSTRDGDRPRTDAGTIATDLRRVVRGSVWAYGDGGYDEARTVWNGAVDHRPAVVARCVDADDVRAALHVAGQHGVQISVRGGGHDWAGRAIREDGLVIDLSAMRTVRIDPVESLAQIEGGVLAGELLDAAAPYGLVTPAGTVRGVGMVGMTLAGGYGGLIGRFGLALDNLISAEVVLADGSTVHAGPEGDQELWWALRGGGGNFGVLTSARFRLHRLGPVLGGMVMYPYEQAGQVLRGYREVIAAAPDELTVMAGFLPGPDGGPVVFVAPTWSGDLDAGQDAVAPLTRLGRPLMTALQPMPYPELLRMFDAGSAAGNRYALGSHWLPELTDEAITALAGAALTRSSPMSLLAVHQFHGAATRVAPEATAFALRRSHLLAEVIAAWPPGEAAESHREWVDDATAALAPSSIPGGYPNILGPDDAERVRLGFGGNLDRLRVAKRRYDPDHTFIAIGALDS